MKYLKKFESDIPWAETNRLGSSNSFIITRDNLPKPGDKVRCLDKAPEYGGGGGWKPGRIFIVGRISHNDSDRPVIWPEQGGSGVYYDALEFIY